MGRRFWDAQRRDEYVRQRDAALRRQAEERDGTAVARDIDASWAALDAEARAVLARLLDSGTRCCVADCSDPVLSRLVERGMLSWPPGVRAVVNEDLATLFMVPPAVWAALEARRAHFAASGAEAIARVAGRFTPVACDGEPAAGPRTSAVGRATLLLTARLDDTEHGPRPLSLSEYHHLARWLDEAGVSFAALLSEEAKGVLRRYPTSDRVLRLLDRTREVDALLARIDRLGLWVIGERDGDFPSRLRERLKTGCLPLLFGAGPAAPLDQGGLCVVGSRHSPAEALEFAQLLGRRAGDERLVVISSDMRGVDRDVVCAALAAGGRVICVLSDSLEKAVASKRFAEALASGRATLVTPFMPDIGFTVANAMRANRYQYALSDAAVVVEARQSGGIWSGAEENRKHRWVPAFVRAGASVSAGNNALLHLGLTPIAREDVERAPSLVQLLVERASRSAEPQPPRPTHDLYAIFLSELARLDAATAGSEAAVAAYFGIEIEQARAWLARAGRLRPPDAR